MSTCTFARASRRTRWAAWRSCSRRSNRRHSTTETGACGQGRSWGCPSRRSTSTRSRRRGTSRSRGKPWAPSLDGAAAVEADIPATVARELWRHRIRAGTRAAALGTPSNRKGDSFVGEIVEGLPMRTRLQFIFRGADRKARNINAGEARGRKALWRDIANNAAEHGRRHLVVYDSAATVGAASKGRSPALAMMKELRRTYPNILPADCAEGAL